MTTNKSKSGKGSFKTPTKQAPPKKKEEPKKAAMITRQPSRSGGGGGALSLNLNDLARNAGNSISQFFGGGKIFGSGSYKMNGNNCNWSTASQMPQMSSSNGVFTVSHREYIGDISSSTAYVTQRTLAINPGLPASFPYLSTIASCFQEYKFKGLVYEFKSTSADALSSTNTALGEIALVAQYRADMPVPTTKQQLLNEMWSQDGKPSENLFLPIECAPVENPLTVQYVRTGALSSNQDQKLYDLATVSVATSGSQAAAVIGELWVIYTAEFRKPVMNVSAIGRLSGSSAHYATFTVTSANPLGSAPVKLVDDIGLVLSTGTITLPAGSNGTTWLVIYTTYAGTSVTNLGLSAGAGLTVNSSYNNGASSFGSSGSTTTSQTTYQEYTATTDGTSVVTVTGTFVGTTLGDLTVVQVQQGSS